MSKRYDVLSPRPRKGQDKPYWHRVGTAWEGDRGINIVFDSLPLPDAEGRVSVSLFEPREQNQQRPGNRQRQDDRQSGGGGGSAWDVSGGFDDDVPFATCDPAYEPLIRRRVVA